MSGCTVTREKMEVRVIIIKQLQQIWPNVVVKSVEFLAYRTSVCLTMEKWLIKWCMCACVLLYKNRRLAAHNVENLFLGVHYVFYTLLRQLARQILSG